MGISIVRAIQNGWFISWKITPIAGNHHTNWFFWIVLVIVDLPAKKARFQSRRDITGKSSLSDYQTIALAEFLKRRGKWSSYISSITCGCFHKGATPSYHPNFWLRDFPVHRNHPAICWGTPMTMETHSITHQPSSTIIHHHSSLWTIWKPHD